MHVKAYSGSLSFDGRAVTITREGFLARASHGRGEKRIPLKAIQAVQWKDAGRLTNGFIQFTVAGGVESTAQKGGRTAAAAGDENSVVFTRKQAADVRAFRDAVQAAMDDL